MQLNTYAIYGLLTVRTISQTERPVSNAELGEELGIRSGYAQQVTLRLMKAGLLESHRGPTGGYTLVRPLEKITVKEVIEASGLKRIFDDVEGEQPTVQDTRLCVADMVEECLGISCRDFFARIEKKSKTKKR